ncbi:MAG TPA: hypothetical protein VIL37_20640 [Natronosporangium sp.]
MAGQGSRGAAEIGVVAVVGALLAGGLVGVGLTDTVVSLSDGLTWLGDDERGELVQINPATGDPQARLEVAPDGSQLLITQGDGVLVVTNLTTGEVTVINTATLTAGGTRAGTAGGLKVLFDQTRLYLADLPLGIVQQIDPTTAADIGAPWVAGAELLDAAIDGQGRIRALRADGQLFTLGPDPAAGRLREVSQPRTVTGAGPGTVLVPHPRGVTAFVPQAGAAVRVDTGRDRALPVNPLTPPLYPAPTAPLQVVPVSMERTGTVVVIYDDELVTVDAARLGCQRPGQPVVFRGLVHVPCLGAGKVIVLTRDGRDRPADIQLGGRGDPKLVLDDGRLIIHTPGAGVVVEPDGTTRPINTRGGDLPARNPSNPPPVPPPPPPPAPPASNPLDPDRDNPTNPGNQRDPDRPAIPPPASNPGPLPTGGTSPSPGTPGAGTPGPGTPGTGTPDTGTPGTGTPPPTTIGPPAPPTTAPPVAEPEPPTGVTAQAGPTGTIQVGWQAATDPDQFRIRRADTGAVLATVPGTARSATVTTIAPGESVRLVVAADYGTTIVESEPTPVVTAFAAPGAPTGVAVEAVVTGGVLRITVTWQPGNPNGSALTGHTVRVTSNRGHDLSTQVGGDQASAVFDARCDQLPVTDPPCGGMVVNAEVTPANAAGAGPTATGSRTYDPPSAPPTITELFCEYTGNRSAVCTLTYTGVATVIDWNVNALDGKTAGRVGCTPDGRTVVTVTVSNPAGSAEASTRINPCSGQPR